MIGYLLALFPIYIFIYLPVSQLLGLPSFSSSLTSSSWSSSSSGPHDDHEHSFNESFIAFEDPDIVCHEHTYTTHILSREPLVLYLEGWLAEGEIEHLLEIRSVHTLHPSNPPFPSLPPTFRSPSPPPFSLSLSLSLSLNPTNPPPFSQNQFQPSHISTGPTHFTDPLIRLSEVATLPRTPTVQCIEARARSLQGWSRQTPQSQGWTLFGSSAPTTPHAEDRESSRGGIMLERLKIQKYGPGGHYTHHFDWQGGAGTVDRVSSFMVYVDANCTGGGTGFPRLGRPGDRRWCRYIECGEEEEERGHEGVIFKPVRGNAVFWENLRADGSGYLETWHAGLPVETGTKVGLNIWSWYRF
jgi:prolyl 4-hydroxylase